MEPENENEPEGDIEMIPVYIKQFLPAITQLYHSSLSQTLRYLHIHVDIIPSLDLFIFRKECLQLIEKMYVHVTTELLKEICTSNEEEEEGGDDKGMTKEKSNTVSSFPAQISEILSQTLESEVGRYTYIAQSR